jgi:O-antigen/teichoic acid export membrane protein
MGKTFARSAMGVLGILAIGALMNGMSYLPYNMLQAIGRPDLTGKFHLLELPFYVMVCLILIPRWGIAGAALASTIRFTLDFGLLFWAATKYGGCSLRDFSRDSFPRILFLGVFFAVGLAAVRLGLHNLSARLAAGVVEFLLYIPAAWLFAVEIEEKPRIRRTVQALFGQPASSPWDGRMRTPGA